MNNLLKTDGVTLDELWDFFINLEHNTLFFLVRVHLVQVDNLLKKFAWVYPFVLYLKYALLDVADVL